MPTSLRPLLDSASEAMLVVDRSGAILLANQNALDLFGYAASELDGQLVETLVPEPLRLRHINHRLQFTDELRMRPMGGGRQLFGRRKDGTEWPVEISLKSVPRGLQTLIIVAVHAVDRPHPHVEAQ